MKRKVDTVLLLGLSMILLGLAGCADLTPTGHTVSIPNIPSGPSSGEVGQSLTYSTGGSSCNQGHSVQYLFDWGDGTSSAWSSSTTASKTWNSTGTYQVKAQARCEADPSVVSAWSSARSVSVTAPPPAPIRFSGRGDTVTDTFHLTEGLATFEFRHTGRSNFIAWLYDTGGNRVDLLVNVIGSYSGTAVVGVRAGALWGAKPGLHLLEIKADGAWEVTIRQPRHTSGAGLPWEAQGTGDSVSSPFVLPAGTIEFTFQHTGRSNFIVWLYAADGRRLDLLVNVIGAYSGSKVVGVRGVHVLAISADGQWSVVARQR